MNCLDSPVRKAVVAALCYLLLAAPSMGGYVKKLSSEDIRNAYFLGSGSLDSFARVFAAYSKSLPQSNASPAVNSIEVVTPFRAVAERARQHSTGYSAQQAEEEYRRSAPSFVVRIHIGLAPEYADFLDEWPGASTSDTLWRDFKYQIKQDDFIEPKSVTGRPVYLWSDFGPPLIVGAIVELHFDPSQITSDTLHVTVTPPFGDPITIDFELDDIH